MPILVYNQYHKVSSLSSYDDKSLGGRHKSIFSDESGRENYPKICDLCNTPLRFGYDGGFMSSQSDTIIAGVCPRCGWWWFYWSSGWESGASFTEATALLREFAVDSADVPNTELIRYLDRNPEELGKISPAKFESLVADIYKEVLGCSIESCSYGRPDKGIDVICLRTDSNREFAIQVKRYHQPIKLGLIHQFFGALFDNGFSEGFFVTAGRFQRGCLETAARLQEKSGITINLVDGNRFLGFVNVLASENMGRIVCPLWQKGYVDLANTSDYLTFDD